VPIDQFDPFVSASAAKALHDEDPERITAGRYRLPDLIISPNGDLITGDGPRKGGWQRVTTMVKAIGDARALDLWHQRMLVMGFVKRPDLYDLACATVATLEATGAPAGELREAMEKISNKVLAAVGADEGANLGTAFHGFTEAQDLGMMHYARRVWHGKLANYRDGLHAQGLAVEPTLIERKIVVLRYGLAGTLDRILADTVHRTHRIGDLKSQKKFWTWLEIAAQMAAYAMADAMWDRAKRCYVDMPPVDQDEAVVAWMPVAHPDGLTGDARPGAADGVDFFSVNLEKGRAALDLCHEVDKLRSEAKSVKQTWGLLRPAPHLAAVEAFAARLDEVASPAEGSAVWSEIVKAGLGDSAELREIAGQVNRRLIEADLRG
jgi:hypothetical protein